MNTLILVHTKALLDQWKTRLEEFLEIDYTVEDTSHKRGRKKAFSPFGTLDSKGNNLHGIIDIALMQSCFEENDVKSFIRNYGMVIVDESLSLLLVTEAVFVAVTQPVTLAVTNSSLSIIMI